MQNAEGAFIDETAARLLADNSGTGNGGNGNTADFDGDGDIDIFNEYNSVPICRRSGQRGRGLSKPSPVR